MGTQGAWRRLGVDPQGWGDPASCSLQVPPGGNKTQYEEISIPVALLSHRDLQDIFKVGTGQGSVDR